MKTVLVTGAGGYIGSVLCPKLIDAGYFVVAVDRFFFGEDKLQNGTSLLKYNIDVRDGIPQRVFTDTYAVIDLAALSNDPAGEQFSVETDQINHKARVKTAQTAKEMGVSRYILPSSASIYGFNSNIVDETDETNPLTAYAKANLNAENDILPLGDDNFCVTVMRQSTVFGKSPRQRLDLAINIMTYNAFTDGNITINGDGNQFRPFVHVQDTTDFMILLLNGDITETKKINKEIFNVGNESNNMTVREVANTIQELFKEHKKEIQLTFNGAVDHRNYKLSFNKVQKVLGWNPRYSVKDGVNEIYQALCDNNFLSDQTTATLPWYNKLEKYNTIMNNLNGTKNRIVKQNDYRITGFKWTIG